MTIGDEGFASICLGRPHLGSPCERCQHVTLSCFPTHEQAIKELVEAAEDALDVIEPNDLKGSRTNRAIARLKAAIEGVSSVKRKG